jgi:hypothetical protein
MGPSADCGKMASSVSARTDGAVRTAMVRPLIYLQYVTSLLSITVCRTNQACASFPLAGQPASDSLENGEVDPEDMVCYQGGETVFNNHQFCDVTNKGIVDALPGRAPQVTFACDKNTTKCDFQFWVDQVESFYCTLNECDSGLERGYENGTDVLTYGCKKMRCGCVPGRFLCGENGGFGMYLFLLLQRGLSLTILLDLGEFFDQEIRGPGKFVCKNSDRCRFEEPAMNELIDSVFGDDYIALRCEGGECLHKSQVPGYTRPPRPDNTRWIAVSLASAGALVLVVLASASYFSCLTLTC